MIRENVETMYLYGMTGCEISFVHGELIFYSEILDWHNCQVF